MRLGVLKMGEKHSLLFCHLCITKGCDESLEIDNNLVENAIDPVVGYFGVMVPPVSVKPCHFERYCNDIKN